MPGACAGFGLTVQCPPTIIRQLAGAARPAPPTTFSSRRTSSPAIRPVTGCAAGNTLQAVRAELARAFADSVSVQLFSAESRQGVDELRATVAGWLEL